jgi:ribonuclease HI
MMATKKYYAVQAGRVPGIYMTWNDCQKQVVGYKGAKFKSFPTQEAAQAYLNGGEAALTTKEVVAEGWAIYVDGSFLNGRYGWGFAAYRDGVLIYSANGSDDKEEAAALHNVAGELKATIEAVRWAREEGFSPITIYHDYAGISEWALGHWKTNRDLTRRYADYMSRHLSWVNFCKVTGHTGVVGNELADKLAKDALGIR